MPTSREDDDDYEDIKRKKNQPQTSAVENVIPFRNGYALAAYYLGIFGLIPCLIGLGLVGLVPLILGIVGLRKAATDELARGRVHAWIGILLGAVEVLISCIAISVFSYMIATNKMR